MMKIIRLIYLNILGLFDINKVVVARENGVVSSEEKKVIIAMVISFLYGYAVYMIFSRIKLTNVYDIVNVGFVLTSIFCLIVNIQTVSNVLFKSTDNDYLFSLPLTKNEIIFSKLFTVYLKNLLYVVIFMFAFLLAYRNQGGVINETLVLMYFIMGLLVPCIAIVVATICSLMSSYFKVKINNSFLYNFFRVLFLGIVIVLLYLYFGNIDLTGQEALNLFLLKFKRIYPVVYLFDLALRNVSLLGFVAYILLNVLIIYLYLQFVSYNYSKICSVLKGVKTRKKFVYHKKVKLGKIGGFVRKELFNLFRNKRYFFSSFGYNILFSGLLVVMVIFVDVDKLMSMENFEHYFKLFIPNILAMFCAISGFGICAMSLEGKNLEIIASMPIRMWKVIFAKWLVNIIVGTVFVIINACCIIINFKTDSFLNVMLFLMPFMALMFISLLNLALDYRFIEKEVNTITDIIQARLVNLIPTFMSLLIAVGPLFFVNFLEYEISWLTFVFVFFIGLIFIMVYLIIFRKKLLCNAFN